MNLGSPLEAVLGDITTQATDAIVNAANPTLMGGGGVDGAIHAAAGPDLLRECREIRRTEYPDGLPTGEAVTTGAGHLPSRFVIHTVGPRYWEHVDGGAELLADCHRNSLAQARRVGARTVAFPAISCGVYGWRTSQAAPIAVDAVRSDVAEHGGIDLVRFVLFNEGASADFVRAVQLG